MRFFDTCPVAAASRAELEQRHADELASVRVQLRAAQRRLKSAAPPQPTHGERQSPEKAGLEAELRGMSFRELVQRAQAMGIADEQLDAAADAPAVIACILEKATEATVPEGIPARSKALSVQQAARAIARELDLPMGLSLADHILGARHARSPGGCGTNY